MKMTKIKLFGITMNAKSETIIACDLLQHIDLKTPKAAKIMSTRAPHHEEPLANHFIATKSKDNKLVCLLGHELLGCKSIHPAQDVIVTLVSDDKNSKMPELALPILIAIRQKTDPNLQAQVLHLFFQIHHDTQGLPIKEVKEFRKNVFGSDEPIKDLGPALHILGLGQRASSLYKKFEASEYAKEQAVKIAKPRNIIANEKNDIDQQEAKEDIKNEVINEDTIFDDLDFDSDIADSIFNDPFSDDDKNFDEIDSQQSDPSYQEDIDVYQKRPSKDSQDPVIEVHKDECVSIQNKLLKLRHFPHYETAKINWDNVHMKGKLTLRSMEYVFVVALLHNYPIPFEEMINKLALEDKWTCYHLIPAWLGDNYLEKFTRDKISEAEQLIANIDNQH